MKKKRKRKKHAHPNTGLKRASKPKRKHKRPVPEAFKAQWARNRTKHMATKKTHRKRKHHAGKHRKRRHHARHSTSFGLVPSKPELYDLVGTAAFAAAERKAAAEPDFVINKVPRPIDAIGWAGNLALMARIGAFAARKFLPAIAKPLRHFATGAGHVATYQLMRNGKLFEAGGAAAPWAGPDSAPAAGTAPPAADKKAEAPSSSSPSTAGYDDDDLDVAGLAADMDEEDELAGDFDDDDELAGDDGEISDTDMSGLPFEGP